MAEKILRIVTVVFKKQANGSPIFLLLHRCLHWKGWELPKGQMEPNESPEEAAKREIFEETGLEKIRILKRVDQTMHFFDKIRKKESEVFGFLVEALEEKPVSFKNNPVREHDSFEWADAKTVLQKIHFENTREFFSSAIAEMGVQASNRGC